MASSHRFLTAFFSICVFTLIASPSLGMISVGTLTKRTAKEKYGITMHARKNGDAGIKVWLEFKKEGWLEKFTYAELRIEDEDGKHLLSAHLQPNPVHHRQAKDVTTVAFSADADQLRHCSFLVVCYGSNEGDVGYYLKVKDFLDLEDPLLAVRSNDSGKVNSAEANSRECSVAGPRSDCPRTVVGKWLNLVLADNIGDSLTLTTKSKDLHARRPLLRLMDNKEVRVVRSLGNESVAVVVTNSVEHVGSGLDRAFAFWLVRCDDSWLINLSYIDDPESIEQQLRGFYMGGGVRWRATNDDLVGTWLAGPGPPCGVGTVTCGSRFQLEADGSFTLETWGPGGPDDGTDIKQGTWRLEEDRIIREQDDQRLVSRISWMGNDSMVLQPSDRKSDFGKLGTEYQRE